MPTMRRIPYPSVIMTLTLSITLPITLVGDGYSCGGVPHRRTTLKYTKKTKILLNSIVLSKIL